MTDAERREVYALEWLNAYKGDHGLFTALARLSRRHPKWRPAPAIVTAVVRFSADEVWKPDPALEAKILREIGPMIRSTKRARRNLKRATRNGGHQHQWSAYAGTGDTLQARCLTCPKIRYKPRPSRQGTTAGHPQDEFACQDAAG